MIQLNNFLFTLENHVAHVVINRPEKANAFDATSWTELRQVMEYCSEIPDIRAVVVSGAGERVFTAGIDLSLLMGTRQKIQDDCEGRMREKFRKFLLELQDSVSAIEACTKPVLMAIHGGCIGGGVDIIVAADMRYCTEDAYFTIKEIDMGMVADLGTLQRLPKLMPDGLVRELAYTGRPLPAQEAHAVGLVNRVFGSKTEMLDAVMAIAKTIAEKSPLSVRGTKRNLLFARDHSVAESLEYIANWNAAMFLSADLTAAFTATVSKQKPTFKD